MRKSRLAVGATGSCVFVKSRRLTYVCKRLSNCGGLCSCLGPCKFSRHGFWDRIVHLVEKISWKWLSVCILNVQGNSYQGRALQWGGATAGDYPPTHPGDVEHSPSHTMSACPDRASKIIHKVCVKKTKKKNTVLHVQWKWKWFGWRMILSKISFLKV